MDRSDAHRRRMVAVRLRAVVADLETLLDPYLTRVELATDDLAGIRAAARAVAELAARVDRSGARVAARVDARTEADRARRAASPRKGDRPPWARKDPAPGG